MFISSLITSHLFLSSDPIFSEIVLSFLNLKDKKALRTPRAIKAIQIQKTTALPASLGLLIKM